MPSLNEKPWQTEGNILVTAGTAAEANKKVLWTLKALLTGQISSDAAGSTVAGANSKTGLWTVVASSDSVNVSVMGAATPVDYTGSTFTAGQWVVAAGATAHTWIVLKSPDALGPYWLTLDYHSNGTANAYQTKMYLAKVAPTGGSITARPTSTDEWAQGTNQQDFIESVVGPFRCHLLLNATTGEFWFPVGWGGAIKTVIGVQKIDSSTDPYPVVSCLAYSIAGGVNGPLGHCGPNAGGSPLLYNSTTGFRGREPLLGNAVTGLAALTWKATGGSSGGMEAVVTPAADGTWPEVPAYLCDNLSAFTYVKGRIPDCYWVAPAAVEGSVAVDTGGTVYSAVFSDAWLPWTATYLPII